MPRTYDLEITMAIGSKISVRCTKLRYMHAHFMVNEKKDGIPSRHHKESRQCHMSSKGYKMDDKGNSFCRNQLYTGL